MFVSLTKKEYGFALYFLKIFIKFLNSMSDEWLNAICLISLLLGIFIIKKYVVISLTFFGTLK